MALITRMSRLLRADLHAVLDRLEEPEQVLRQAVREMETALAEDRRRRARLAHELTRLRARQDTLARAVEDADEQLGVCFEAGDDALARALIRRRLEAEHRARAVSERVCELTGQLARQEARIEEAERRLDDVRQRAELLRTDEAEPDRAESWSESVGVVSADDVEVALLREKQRRSRS
ncbi:MAG: PspA/IM30 family protein [Ectothiorhodospiraceae bacterium]|nr:PspA/IM30 family protein [Chromatiales bacterium]MCP5154866.1 PspA/IM30 family protein [Ectothiorhodospiraceae bacterium]